MAHEMLQVINLTTGVFEGIDKAKAEVERLSTEAADIFASYSKEDNFLKELVLMLINREK